MDNNGQQVADARAYLAGVLHGDGWCTHLTLGLRVADQDFAEAFALALNLVCGTTYAPRRDERGYWLLRAGNKSGRFSGLKGFVARTDRERAMWLRGLFD